MATIVECTKTGDWIRIKNEDQTRNHCPHRLFVGNLPKTKTEQDICTELKRKTFGLVRVITYKNFENPTLHRGFCFLDYESRAAAVEAKCWLSWNTMFGCRTIIDWADPEPEFDDDTMAVVRILFVRQYGGTLSEEVLTKVFSRYGTIERVKNLKNYSFVHFARREDAQAAMDNLDGATDIDSGVSIDVLWAKPPADREHRERMLRNREWRMRQTVGGRRSYTADVLETTKSSDTVSTTFRATLDPYAKYEHYCYDFSHQGLDCQFQKQSNAPPQSRGPLYCKLRLPTKTNGRDVNESYDHARRHDRAGDLHESGDEIRSRDFRSLGFDYRRSDRGDCKAAVRSSNDVDSNILKFFHKVIHGGNTTVK
ncbi:RNA recognition motif domain [Cinara cedri]|uniref:RNA recognition motif domain n=1 Tax=Cinara cedri TaxID=506608 RepID=A0A5E4MCT0_9HEMI|nr:RNA recognition motif domain [Cinara cedri]